MTDDDFLRRVKTHPRLTLVHHDKSICIIRYAAPGGPRDIRLGFWAVQEHHWEQLLEALAIPLEAAVA